MSKPKNLIEALIMGYPNIPIENAAYKGMDVKAIHRAISEQPFIGGKTYIPVSISDILPKDTIEGTPIPSQAINLVSSNSTSEAKPHVIEQKEKVIHPDNRVVERVVKVTGYGIPASNQIYRQGDVYTNVPATAEGAIPVGIKWKRSSSINTADNINWEGIAQLFRDKRITPQFINWATQLILNVLKIANQRQQLGMEQAYRQQALDLQRAQAEALIQQRRTQPIKNLANIYRDLLKQEVEIMKAYNDLGNIANTLGKKPEEIEAMKLRLIDLYRNVSARRQAIEAQLQQLGQGIGNYTSGTALPY